MDAVIGRALTSRCAKAPEDLRKPIPGNPAKKPKNVCLFIWAFSEIQSDLVRCGGSAVPKFRFRKQKLRFLVPRFRSVKPKLRLVAVNGLLSAETLLLLRETVAAETFFLLQEALAIVNATSPVAPIFCSSVVLVGSARQPILQGLQGGVNALFRLWPISASQKTAKHQRPLPLSRERGSEHYVTIRVTESLQSV